MSEPLNFVIREDYKRIQLTLGAELRASKHTVRVTGWGCIWTSCRGKRLCGSKRYRGFYSDERLIEISLKGCFVVRVGRLDYLFELIEPWCYSRSELIEPQPQSKEYARRAASKVS